MANTRGEKELKTNWPIEDGLTAATTKQTGHRESLVAQKSLLTKNDLKGI